MSVIMLSGPVGAGKTTIARDLVGLLRPPASHMEGDTFWSFIAKSDGRDRREEFRVIMRAMTAAAIPFARAGYEVLLDFSIPPEFLETARKILKEVLLDYVVVLPSLATCEARAAARPEGKIQDYAKYREFYAMFEAAGKHAIRDDEAEPAEMAKRIHEGLGKGAYRVL